MSYKPLSDEEMMGEEYPRGLDSIDAYLIAQEQCLRANRLAEAVARETSGWDKDNRMVAALAAYLGQEEKTP